MLDCLMNDDTKLYPVNNTIQSVIFPPQTAKVMLDCLMHDVKHTVRRTALGVFVNHPRRYDVSKDQENTLLR